jgi:triphosphatase
MPEIELKLAVAAGDLPKARAALLAMAGRPSPSRARLVTTYYETDDDALRQHELMLRLRRTGRQFIQSLKAHDLAGEHILARGEWEDPVKRDAPDLAAPKSGARVRDAVGARALRPLFRTSVERTSFALSPRSGSTIEVAIDRGEIRAGDARAPICEIELELKAGETVVLWDVGLRLLEIVPCRIETRSKGERGYCLARGSRWAAPARHASAVTLEPEMTVDAALQCVGRRLIAMLLRNESSALELAPEGIHQMRIAVRRLRAILSSVRKLLPKEHFRWANGELKWLGAELAPARNWDVFTDGLLQPVTGALSTERELRRLAAASHRQRQPAYKHASAAILSPRYTATMMRLSRWFEDRGWRDQPVTENSARLMEPIRKVAPDMLARLHRRALKRARHFATLAPPERHRLRIALKKLRYGAEFVESFYGASAVARFMKRVKAAQEDLGHANDVSSARTLVDELGGAEDRALMRAGGIVLGWHDRGLAQTEARTRRRIRRFRRTKPFW